VYLMCVCVYGDGVCECVDCVLSLCVCVLLSKKKKE
jgi:hypothetical protein